MQTILHTASSVVPFLKGLVARLPLRLSNRGSSLLALSLLLSILVAACGGGSSSESASSEAGQGAPAAQEAQAPAANEESAPPDIADRMEFGLTLEELLQTIEEVEAKIAQCMSDAGFEYVAVDANTVREAMSADKELPGLSEEQFYSQYGLGIATLYTGEPPQLSDMGTPASMGLGEQNIAVFQNLSATDQVAYNQTLLGEHLDAPLAVALEREDISRTGGCTRTAIEQVIPSDRLTVSYVNPKDYAIDNDERMVAAFAQYGECVKEAGYEITNPDEIRPMITEQLDEITGGAPVAALSAEAQAALTELQEFERAIASASFACEEEIITPLREQMEQELSGS